MKEDERERMRGPLSKGRCQCTSALAMSCLCPLFEPPYLGFILILLINLITILEFYMNHKQNNLLFDDFRAIPDIYMITIHKIKHMSVSYEIY